MSNMLVTQQNIVEVARQCRGQVRASDADGTHGALFVQVDVPRLGHDRDTRAYVGDTIVEHNDMFVVLRSGSLAA
jgi:hypothetical protein